MSIESRGKVDVMVRNGMYGFCGVLLVTGQLGYALAVWLLATIVRITLLNGAERQALAIREVMTGQRLTGYTDVPPAQQPVMPVRVVPPTEPRK